MNIKITELMPSTVQWPEWAQEAAAEGRLFRECMKRLDAYSSERDKVKDILSGGKGLNVDTYQNRADAALAVLVPVRPGLDSNE